MIFTFFEAPAGAKAQLRGLRWAVAALAVFSQVACGDKNVDDGSSQGEGGANSDERSGSGGNDSGSGTGGNAANTQNEAGADVVINVRSFSWLRSEESSLEVRNLVSDSAVSACTIQEEGECTLSICPLDAMSNDGASRSYLDVGTVEAIVHLDATPQDFFDDEFIAHTITSQPQGDGSYAVETLSHPEMYVVGEEVVEVNVSGGELGDFSMTGEFPLLLVIKNTHNNGLVEVTSSSDFELNWERGNENRHLAIVTHQASTDSTSEYRLNCTFEKTPNQGSIPSALTSQMPAGGDYIALTVDEKQLEVAGKTVKFNTVGQVTIDARSAGVHLTIAD